MRDWKVHGFDESAWEALKESFTKKDFCTSYSDFFGNIYCGALDYDIVLYECDEDGWFVCADAFLLGKDTGYGDSESGIPYDGGDGRGLTVDVNMTYEEALASFVEQVDDITNDMTEWAEYADKTEPKWEDEYKEG